MAKMTDDRELILGVLLEITRDGVYSHIAIRNVLEKYQYLDKKRACLYHESCGRNAGEND